MRAPRRPKTAGFLCKMRSREPSESRRSAALGDSPKRWPVLLRGSGRSRRLGSAFRCGSLVCRKLERIIGLEIFGSDDIMSEFRHLDTKEPAQMGAVVEAVLRLSTFSERQILDLVSEGQLGELFPFRSKTRNSSGFGRRRRSRRSVCVADVPITEGSLDSIQHAFRLALASEAIAWQPHWRGKKKSFALPTKNHIDSP